MRDSSATDELLVTVQAALSTLAGVSSSARDYPAAQADLAPPDPAAAAQAGALMRVNHVGEICAQGLYLAQALATRNPRLRTIFRSAALEEADHLAWTRRRLGELSSRPSLLSPLWFAGSFAIGLAAGRLGDRISLGFMAETERQVEEHLASHLDNLPASDAASRLIVEQMKADESGHGQTARNLGAPDLPVPVPQAMRLAARVMTTVAHYI